MMPESSAAVPSGRFVRRCCMFYLCALLGFWIFSVGEMYTRCRRLNKPFSVPSSFFVYQGKDVFRDFLHFDPVTERFGKDTGLPTIVYPAPMVCMYILFTRVFSAPLNAYLMFVIISATSAAAFLILSLSYSGANRLLLAGVVASSLIFSYPLIFLLERANIEGVVWVVLALGLTAFVARHHATAAILFALAASMKIFPGVLLLLLLTRKRYKEFAVSVVAFAAFTVIALRLLGPSIPAEFEEVGAGLAKVSATNLLAYRVAEVGYDHSLFNVVKQLLSISYRQDPVALDTNIRAALLPYSLFVIPGFLVVYWFRIRKLPLLNQATSLIILAVILPYSSFEYTLNHIYLAWALFVLFLARDVSSGRESIPWPVATVMLASFAFVFAPAPFDLYAGHLKTCALMVLLLGALTVPMYCSFLEPDLLMSGTRTINPGQRGQTR